MLRDENNKLKEANDLLKIETSSFHVKAEELAEKLAVLTDELNSKEKAIRRYQSTIMFFSHLIVVKLICEQFVPMCAYSN